MFPQLGRALAAAFRRASGRLAVFTENLILGDRAAARTLAATHLDGRRVARATHGVLLPTSVTLTNAEAVLWRQTAIGNAQRVIARAEPILAAGITRFEATRYANIVLTQTIWNGQDQEAARIASEANAL